MSFSMLILIAAAVALLGYVYHLFNIQRSRGIRDRLAQASDPTNTGLTSASATASDLGNRILNHLKKQNFLAQLLANMNDWLGQAGLSMSESQLLTLHALGFTTGAAIGFMVLKQWLGVLMLGGVGLVVPYFAIRQLGQQRAKAFDKLFGDTVVLMTATIRSGFALRQAMQVVADEMPDPIAEEFRITLSEINMGMSQDDALQNLARRMPNEDLDLFVTAVLIQGDIGGDLSSVLEKIAQTIRERIQIRNELGALTAQGKMSGIMVAALPVLILAAIGTINPGYIKVLFQTDTGHKILLAAIVMEGIGGLVIRKMVRIEG